ncbi:MAG: hypothetical protein WA667_02725 [Candidatus Nitrosopolaris sp.]
MRSKKVMLMLTVLALLTATAATTTTTSNLALADNPQKLVEEKLCANTVLCEDIIGHVSSFQQQPRIATGPAFAGGSTVTMVYADKKGSDWSSSSATLPSSTTSTDKDPHKYTSSNNINPPQPSDGSPPASRTNINNPDASADTTTPKGNTGTTTDTTQPVTITNGPSLAQQQQQNPTPDPLVTSQNPPLVTLPLVGPITCNELLQNGNCIPQPPTCAPIKVSQSGKCGPQPSCSRQYHLEHGTCVLDPN